MLPPLHIILLEPSGEIFFEGDSVLRAPPKAEEDDEDDSGPPTLRSAA